jgi:hypothetical protein
MAGLLGCRIDMTDQSVFGFACPFFGLDCPHRFGDLEELKEHMRLHPGKSRLYLEVLGSFWGPVIYFCVENSAWPSVGSMIGGNISGLWDRIHPTTEEQAVSYWVSTAEEDDEAKRSDVEEVEEAVINGQESGEDQLQVQVKMAADQGQTYHAHDEEEEKRKNKVMRGEE